MRSLVLRFCSPKYIVIVILSILKLLEPPFPRSDGSFPFPVCPFHPPRHEPPSRPHTYIRTYITETMGFLEKLQNSNSCPFFFFFSSFYSSNPFSLKYRFFFFFFFFGGNIIFKSISFSRSLIYLPLNIYVLGIELFRLEQRYTRRKNRSGFVSDAQYVDGEYIYSTGGSKQPRQGICKRPEGIGPRLGAKA